MKLISIDTIYVIHDTKNNVIIKKNKFMQKLEGKKSKNAFNNQCQLFLKLFKSWKLVVSCF